MRKRPQLVMVYEGALGRKAVEHTDTGHNVWYEYTVDWAALEDPSECEVCGGPWTKGWQSNHGNEVHFGCADIVEEDEPEVVHIPPDAGS
jgi:hypothetical protein